ncbi:F-box/LRR-repeat protein 2-like [Abrus precatorius]|uniref:F-box/LRR-repeat protein 2-like n=1 Tax=Abrus precatorius TaxID=3816 RepID=A0A8B8KM69_ABRPR|nr:F-box/LRR-repeat protein 2-like [Abrus precatorius]
MPVKDFPEECWELVFKFLGHSHNLESLSMVCKQFLSITNRLQFNLTVYDPTIPLLPRLFLRFSRLKILDLSQVGGDHQHESLLHQVSQSGLDLDLLNLSNQRTLPVDGLRELGSKMTNLRVLICSNIGSLHDSHLVVIAYCFPFLQDLDISFPLNSQASDFGVLRLSSMLENLHKINVSGNHLITDKSLLALCQNCMSLEEISFFTCFKITQIGIASGIRLRPSLTSISFNIEKKRIHGPGLTLIPIDLDLVDSFRSLKRLTAIDLSNSFISDEFLYSVADGGISYLLSKCQSVQCLDLRKVDFLTDQCMSKLSMFLHSLTSINLSGCCQLTRSTFFILTRNCPLLSEIKMERTYIGVEDSNSKVDVVINLEVKTIYLGDNVLLSDANVIEFTSICPSLQLLDLKGCEGVSGECVVEVLKRCEIRHLNMAYTGMRVFDIDFEVCQLKVLNLSGSRIEDEALSMISKRCSGLVLLDIHSCWHVTAKGVREVVENCKALKELNLKNCGLVSDDFVAWVAISRPSLRIIITPSGVGAYC